MEPTEVRLTASVLRPWRWEDEASLVRHANNIKIWRNLRDRFPHPYTLESAREWLSRANDNPREFSLAIEVNGTAAGGIGVMFQEDIFRRSAELGYWLGEEFWGRGIMTEAVKGMTRFAFGRFDLVRIYSGVFASNVASQRVLEKAGFVFEGRLRSHVTKEGKGMDEMMYSILRGELR